MPPLSSVTHLVTRFFGVVTSRRLTPREQDAVNAWLNPEEAALFWDQQAIDQRHAFDVALLAQKYLPGRSDVRVAALLHDVGKRHSRLGAISRSLATILSSLRLPMPESWQRYRNHDALGAQDLQAIGADDLAVAFAAGSEHADSAAWAALVAADNGRQDPAKSSGSGGGRNSIPPEVKR